jgi:hypothetical protein
MKKLINILIITILATMIKSDIMILVWFVITINQGLKLILK